MTTVQIVWICIFSLIGLIGICKTIMHLSDNYLERKQEELEYTTKLPENNCEHIMEKIDECIILKVDGFEGEYTKRKGTQFTYSCKKCGKIVSTNI